MNKDKANLRQRKLAKYMAENVGKSMEQAMLDLGYSASYANSSDKIKKTKGWKYLMRKVLPNSLLVKVAQEGLSATMVKTSLTEPDRELPDFAVRQRYLETALKMRGKLIEKTDIKSGGKAIIPSIQYIIPNDNNSKD